MTKRERPVFTEEFKREAVRLHETNGRTIALIAEDLGVGLSTLTDGRIFTTRLTHHQNRTTI